MKIKKLVGGASPKLKYVEGSIYGSGAMPQNRQGNEEKETGAAIGNVVTRVKVDGSEPEA